MKEIEKVPIEAIAELAQTPQCRLFRQVLIGTIKMAQAQYDEIVLARVATRRRRDRKLRIGFFLANLCIGAVGLANLAAGIVSFFVANLALVGLKRVLDFFYELTEPMIAIQDRLTELIHEDALANKSVQTTK